jgi:hypothetical protein
MYSRQFQYFRDCSILVLTPRTLSVFLLQVEFFQNNTFATIGGMGASTILRGKFYIIGDKKDQLWMQIWRFGFGRSVSGSVYSEGTYLSKDDEKTYWGRIEYAKEDEEGDMPNDKVKMKDITSPPLIEGQSEKSANHRLLVKGSVIFGGNGLEPQPIGRFILTERTTAQTDDDEEEEEEDDDPNINLEGDDNDDQPFYSSDDAFQ